MKQLLIGITNDNKKVIIYEANTLFELDCFTSMFDNYKDLVNKYNKKNNIHLRSITIQTSNGNTINDIVYSSNVIPEINMLCDMYYKYLLEDKIRIKLILDKKEDTDYLKDLIDNATSYDNDTDIILSKIKSNELEPNYYDHEEYLSMKSKGHKK